MRGRGFPLEDLGGRSNRRAATPASAPESDDLNVLGGADDSVVHVVMDALNVNATNSRQCDVQSTSTDKRLKRDEGGHAFKLFTNGVRRLQTIPSPPDVGFPDLSIRELADFDVKRRTHSRRRSSSSTRSIGTVCPRSHCAIDSRSIRSVSGSASKVSSPSENRTVTADPSGSSASSSSTRPPITRPEAIRIAAFYPRSTRIPYACNLRYKFDRSTPKASAVLLTLPASSRRRPRMYCFSNSSRASFSVRLRGISVATSRLVPSWTSSASIVSFGSRIAKRSTTLRSSRTLPGQE